jgi:hypothetical protein
MNIIAIRQEKNLNLSRRTAQEYVEIALFNEGIELS